ncbi:hypothetical protein GCM10007047_01210 [Cerasicoccus arenae]|uniref:Histidine kinase n=1 Tax=Cerasicoccus arenae TaxID=424488 RepID=A0A8J3D954_9BACT|nr:hypothetical protein GCM10007047_01210 [Cerasicoccus arenae]
MNLTNDEETSLRSIVHDMNGQLFLIRGHCEIAKRCDEAIQLEKSMSQIQCGTNELERLVHELRTHLGFPKI